MTFHSPTLIIHKQVVYYAGRVVFEALYREGVNIIHGDNASGKTTVIQLLLHGLGYEVVNWKEEARACDFVLLEISINNEKVTLKREIGQARAPMQIYWGSIEEAHQSSTTGWQLYQYNLSQKKDSFSQVIFKSLNMPEIRGDKSNNITMHQLLRIIAKDQLTQVNRIFSFERFDSAQDREIIGELLLGAYDDELYELLLIIGEKRKEFDNTKQQLRAAREILKRSEYPIELAEIQTQLQSLREKRKDLLDKINKIREDESDRKADERLRNHKNQLESMYSKLREKYDKYKNQRDQLVLDIEDSKLFILEIEKRLTSLNESLLTRKCLSGFVINICPCCLSEIEPVNDSNTCPLCHGTISGESSAVLRKRHELTQQLKESRKLQEERLDELSSVDNRLPSLSSELKTIQQDLMQAFLSINVGVNVEIDELQRGIGSIDNEVETLHKAARLSSVINDLNSESARLGRFLSEASDKVNLLNDKKESRVKSAHKLLGNIIGSMVRADINREDDFSFFESVDIDFKNDRILLNGRDNYAASSLAFLSTAFHVAFVQASRLDANMNYPRLSIIDSIEDKGMDLERKHNLQRIIAKMFDDSDVKFQVIFTTTDLCSDLKDSGLTVGPHYNVDNKTLRL